MTLPEEKDGPNATVGKEAGVTGLSVEPGSGADRGYRVPQAHLQPRHIQVKQSHYSQWAIQQLLQQTLIYIGIGRNNGYHMEL